MTAVVEPAREPADRADRPRSDAAPQAPARRRGFRLRGFAAWAGLVCVAVYLLIATVGQLHGSPDLLDAPGAEPPSATYWFGTDNLGRDVFARTAAGAWNSLVISTGTVVLALLASVPLGMYAGYHHGGRIDNVVMRALETIQALPMFIFVMFVLSLTGTGDISLGPVDLGVRSKLIFCLALGFVPFFARVVRAATLTEMQNDYVPMLQIVGVGRARIMASEILVNIVPPVMVQACLAMAIAIFAEGGLSFLGFGMPPPAPTLGNLIADAASQILEGYWWYALLPGTVMVIGILGFNLLGDATTDYLMGETGKGDDQ